MATPPDSPQNGAPPLKPSIIATPAYNDAARKPSVHWRPGEQEKVDVDPE